jgi:iron-sulfur cluster assembly accessory protein
MVTLTKEAATKVQEIIEEQNAPGSALRIFVRGDAEVPQYGLTLDASHSETDEIIECEGVRIVVDEESLPLVIGSEIDYVETLMRQGFTVSNPNFASGCACGGNCGCGSGH